MLLVIFVRHIDINFSLKLTGETTEHKVCNFQLMEEKNEMKEREP